MWVAPLTRPQPASNRVTHSTYTAAGRERRAESYALHSTRKCHICVPVENFLFREEEKTNFYFMRAVQGFSKEYFSLAHEVSREKGWSEGGRPSPLYLLPLLGAGINSTRE